MNNNFRLALTIIISGLAVIVQYLINFFVTPYVTDHLGLEAYSFVSIAKTSVSYVGIITVALTSFVVRYISMEYHRNQIENANGYFSSALAACGGLSGGIFAGALVIIFRLENVLNISEELISSVKILFVVVFLNFVITTITVPLGSAAYIKNRLDLTGTLKIFAYLCEAVSIVFFFANFNPAVWYVGLGSLIASIILFLSHAVMTRKLTRDLHYQRKLVSSQKVKSMVAGGIWNAFNQLGNTLNSGLDLIISNRMLTGIQTGEIAVAKTIGTIFTTLYAVVCQPFHPQLLKSYASGDQSVFLHEITKAMRISGCFSNIAFGGFIALGSLYYRLWLPNQNTRMLTALTVITVFNSITEGPIHPLYYINTLTLKNKLPSIVTIGGGVVNVITMYLLLKKTNMGSFAVVVTTAVIMVTINLTFNPIYAAKCIGIRPIIIYKVLTRHILSTFAMTAVFIGIRKILSPYNWIGLFTTAIMMTIVGILMHIVIMTSFHEKRKIIEKLKCIAKRTK